MAKAPAPKRQPRILPRRAAAPRRNQRAAATRGSRKPRVDSLSFPIVGIGASAGGLDAYKKLFEAMPASSGMAFVLVPHLDPTHSSLMVELLSKHTAMPVLEARDRMPILRDHVYIIPPNADLAIKDRVLHIVPPPPRRGSQTAIDFFLQSLAADQRDRAVGIILSGTGSHGTLGARAIKAASGMVMAQAPESAEHDQMPRSAIAAGVVDHVLTPAQMPKALLDHLAHRPAPVPDVPPESLDAVMLLLRTRLKRDFRGYRQNMIMRRIRRRMGLCRVDGIAGYIEYLNTHPHEVEALAKDMAIGVTAFFREPEALRMLEQRVIPELVGRSGKNGDGERPVRVWVPGCATGEEAYSIAMLFLEGFAVAKKPVALQVFATDIDDESLDIGRMGLYQASAGGDISPARLQRFFVKVDDRRLQVSKALREVITFAQQNLINDAPFSKLDLIVCRNVFIYLEPDVQAKVIALFHFALNEGGCLLLGPAESIGQATDRFEPLSKKGRVYRRIGSGRRQLVDIPVLPGKTGRLHAPRGDQRPRPLPGVAELLHRTLLADFAPAAVLVNRRYEILSVQGPVVDYLEFPPGELTHDLLSMARSGLRSAIRGMCEQAVQSHRPAVDASARVKRNGTYVSCTVAARAVAGAKDADGLLIVTFHDRRAGRTGGTRTPVVAARRSEADESPVVAQLEYELKATREDLQGTIDELESANEELKASHEEVMSMNEELQSTNEEMESSKEELQSLNEELSAVNSQLQDNVRELDAANDDLVNLLASTEIATVFLDADLRVKRFTTPTAKLFNLLPADIGRPLGDIAPRVVDQTLLEDCRLVAEKLSPAEAVVRAGDARTYLRRVLPYRTADNRIDGVVITWVDVTARLAAEAESRHFGAVLRDSNDAVALLALDGRIIGWNRGAERLYGYTEAQARAMNARDLAPESQREAVEALVDRIARGDVASESGDTQRLTKNGLTRDVWTTMTVLRDGAGQPEAIVITERDVTAIKEGLLAKRAAGLYQQLIEDLPAGAVLRQGERLTMNLAAEVITGYHRDELPTIDRWCAALHGKRAAELRPFYETGPSPDQAAQPRSIAIVRRDGQVRHIEMAICPCDGDHEMWMLLDVTEADQVEQALRRSEEYVRSIVTTAADAIITIDRQGIIETFNPAAERMFGYAAAETVGRNVSMLMPQPYRGEHDHYLTRFHRTRKARIIGVGREVTGQRKDRTTFPLDLAVSQISSTGRFTGILRDLSDRRRLEWRLAESQVEERRHMARELHDDIGGHLTGIGLVAQFIQGRLQKTDSPLSAKAHELVESISYAHQRLRAVIRGLMPVEAIPEGLMAALEDLAAQCETASGIPCRFHCEPPVHVEDAGTALHMFRIAQEAVSNALRHARPSLVTIDLAQTDRGLEFSVADDGIGVDNGTHDGEGIGLESMTQRAHLLGGDLSIEPRPEGGTIVTCRLPPPQSARSARREGLSGKG